MTPEDILLDIDRATEPKVMEKEAALEFLKEIYDQVGSRIDALRDEIEEEN